MNRPISDSTAGLGELDALAPPPFATVRRRGTKSTPRVNGGGRRSTGVARRVRRRRRPSHPSDATSWIAAGDSYSSGEGGPGAFGRCGRSDRAMAQQARALVADEIRIDAFAPVACTGAVIDDVPEQVQTAATPGGAANLVTITIGGNDVGFAELLVDCVGVD